MLRFAVRLLSFVVVVAALASLAPTAIAAAPADGARVDTSDHNGSNHVIIAWPESTGDISIEVEAVESPTDPYWRMTFAGPSEPSPGTISAPCALTVDAGPDYIECHVASNAELQNGIEIWTGDGTDYVSVLTGGSTAPAAIFLRDGTNTQQAIGGDGHDYLNSSAGDESPVGAAYLQGGAGVDQYVPSANAYDVIDFLDPARGTTSPVNVTLDCVANDGNLAFDGGLENAGCSAQGTNGLQGTDGSDTLTGDSGSSVFYGHDGDDVIDAGDATDQLIGGPGADTLIGGGGHDQIDGDYAGGFDTGDDTIFLRDGQSDQVLSCGGGTDTVQLDDEATDTVSSSDCESLDRTGGGGGGGGGGGVDPNLIDPTKSFTIPDFKPYQKKGRWKFTSFEKAKRKLDESQINLNRRLKRVSLRYVKSQWRTSVDDGDVVFQSLAPGSVVTAALAAPYPFFQLAVYEEALDYKGKRCPYNDARKYKPMLSAVLDGTLAFARQYLKQRGCKVVVIKEVVVKGATDSTVSGANISNKKTRKGRMLAVALTVQRPPRQDFRINITERPPADFKQYPKASREIGIGADGKLTAGRAPAVLHLDLFEAATGRAVGMLKVEVVKPDGKVLASTKTTSAGGLTFSAPVDFTGELDIQVQLQPVNGGSEVLEAWTSLDVIDRKRKPFYTKSGRYFRWSAKSGLYRQATPPPTPSQVHAEIANRLRTLAQELAAGNPLFGQAAAILANTSLTPQAALQSVANNVGLLPGALVSAKGPDKKITAASLVQVPAVKLVAGGYLPTTTTVALIPASGDIDTASLVGPDGGTLIGMDGATLIGPDGGSLVGPDGATLIGPDGGTLTSIAGSSLIGMDGATLQSGMKLISDKGVGLGGSGFVPVYR